MPNRDKLLELHTYLCKALKKSEDNLNKHRTGVWASGPDFVRKAEDAVQRWKEWRDMIAEFIEVADLAASHASMAGHDEPCYYCGEPCSCVAGSPSLWPVGLCHSDEPGVLKWHHSGCVSSRLLEADIHRDVEASGL